MSERDTHFQEAAKLLTVQMYRRFGYGIDLRDEDDKEWHTLIAQFAYDLVYHTLMNSVGAAWLDMLPSEEWNARIPDLTVWPEAAGYESIHLDYAPAREKDENAPRWSLHLPFEPEE